MEAVLVVNRTRSVEILSLSQWLLNGFSMAMVKLYQASTNNKSTRSIEMPGSPQASLNGKVCVT